MQVSQLEGEGKGLTKQVSEVMAKLESCQVRTERTQRGGDVLAACPPPMVLIAIAWATPALCWSALGQQGAWGHAGPTCSSCLADCRHPAWKRLWEAAPKGLQEAQPSCAAQACPQCSARLEAPALTSTDSHLLCGLHSSRAP